MTRSRRSGISGGYSMVELVVAIFLSALVVTLIVYTWSGLTRHVYTTDRSSRLHAAADRIITAVSTGIRRSRVVLSFGDREVVYVSQEAGDTVSYRLNYDSTLLCGDVPVHIGVEGARVGEFGVRRVDEGGMALEEGQSEGVLMEVWLELVGPDGRTASASLHTTASALSDAGVWGWGF